MVISPWFTFNTTHDPNTLLNQTEFLKLAATSHTRVYDPDNTAYFKVDPMKVRNLSHEILADPAGKLQIHYFGLNFTISILNKVIVGR